MKAIKILLKIMGVCALIALILWLISYGIGLRIYLQETSNTPKLATLEQQKDYVANKEKEILKDIDIFKLLFAGGGWRYRAILKLHQKIFEYFPEEANNDVNTLFHLADCYVWLGGVKYREKAIELYQKSIDVFEAKHVAENAPPGVDSLQFEIKKYEFLTGRHKQIAGNYQKLHQYDKVLKEYQKIIDSYQNKVKNFSLLDQYLLIGQAYENMGHIYLRIYKKYDEAIKIFQKIQALFPTPLIESINKINIGDCYLAMGQDNKAIEIYKGVIRDYSIKNSAARDAEGRLKNLKMWKKILTRYEPLLY